MGIKDEIRQWTVTLTVTESLNMSEEMAAKYLEIASERAVFNATGAIVRCKSVTPLKPRCERCGERHLP